MGNECPGIILKYLELLKGTMEGSANFNALDVILKKI